VAQLYPQALGTHFSRLLRHEWVTVGLFFNLGHDTGDASVYKLRLINYDGVRLCLRTAAINGPIVRRRRHHHHHHHLQPKSGPGLPFGVS
jgi:fatty acid desaturase